MRQALVAVEVMLRPMHLFLLVAVILVLKQKRMINSLLLLVTKLILLVKHLSPKVIKLRHKVDMLLLLVIWLRLKLTKLRLLALVLLQQANGHLHLVMKHLPMHIMALLLALVLKVMVLNPKRLVVKQKQLGLVR